MNSFITEKTLFTPTLSLSLGVIVLLLWPILSVVRSYRRLSHIPGPFWAHFTGLWLQLKLWNGQGFGEINQKLGEQYGPVVRFGPKNVLFSDPAAIPVIYGTNPVFRKAVSYEPAMAVINGKLQDSLVTTRQEERVTGLKKYINSAFTAAAISDYEFHVNETVQITKDRLNTDGANIDIVWLLRRFAFETICRIAFSDGNFTAEDVESTLVGLKERFTHWQDWFLLPEWERLLYKNSFVRGRLGPNMLVQRAMARVTDREASGGTGSHEDLLDRYLQANNKAPANFGIPTVVGLVMSTIHAGAETTASTLAITIYMLISNPHALATLRQELESAKLESPSTFQSVNKLAYLDAVIKESMRMSPVTVSPLEREVPEGGAHIAGVFIPAGTAVAMNLNALALRSDVWGSKPEAYQPERWLEADDAQRMKMERAFSGFGHGKRVCIGKHIALIEMKKLLSELLLNYDFELLYPDRPWEHETILVILPKELLVRAIPRQRG